MDELDDAIAQTEAALAEARRTLQEERRKAAPDPKLRERIAEARDYADKLEAELGRLRVQVDHHESRVVLLEEKLARLRRCPASP